MYLLANFITMLMIPIQQALSHFQLEDTNVHAQLKFHVARLMNTVMKMASNSRSNLCSR